jgi:hypothetical protein
MPLMPFIPRGIRNNNPGNIRHSIGTVWRGQEATQTDSDFVQFVTPEYGLRAIARIITSYKRDGINTIQDAIKRWAPAVENNTIAYINNVCQQCNVKPADVVDLEAIMPTLIKAIVFHENGMQPYSEQQIQTGISLAAH